MPKIDPKGEVANPIRSKLAYDLARPLMVVPSSQKQAAMVVGLPAEEPPQANETEQDVEPEPEVVATKLSKSKKVLFTAIEQRENDRVVQQIGDVIGAETLGWSHVNRAMWVLIRRAQDQLEQRRKHAPRLMRPSNGNPIELAKFEDSLADYLLMLFKEIPRRT